MTQAWEHGSPAEDSSIGTPAPLPVEAFGNYLRQLAKVGGGDDTTGATLRQIADEVEGMQHDITRLTQIVAETLQETTAAEAEVDDADRLRARMAQLLTDTANALKGPPAELHLHSWHDLPEVAARLRVPPGFKLLPREATPEMLNAGAKFSLTLADAYRDMWDRYECHCEACDPIMATPPGEFFPANMRMILCAMCGNKRCPHARNHRNACTNSNEPGQKGSAE